MNTKQAVQEGRTVLGIEFGSTRIKAVLVDENAHPIAQGGYDWENRYVDNIWSYTLEDIWKGLQGCYQEMAEDVKKNYGVTLKKIGAIGFSGMMHGYMPFDKEGKLLVPFRTWRNNITGQASDVLSELFNFQIPQRWSIAHLYQAILNGEEHVKDVAFSRLWRAISTGNSRERRSSVSARPPACSPSMWRKKIFIRKCWISSTSW